MRKRKSVGKEKVAKRLKGTTTRDRVRHWNEYYSTNNFGILIQCSRCKKWRSSFEYKESYEVPEKWCCSMGKLDDGQKGRCEDPEDEFDDIFLEYCPGSIVWARLDGFPWWPAMVDEDPDLEEYFWKENGVLHYHVTFLDEPVSRAWLPDSHLSPYNEHQRRKVTGLGIKRYQHQNAIKQAELRAKGAMEMTIAERLKRFSFVELFKGKWPLAHDYDEADNTQDITDILLQELDDMDSIKSSDIDNEGPYSDDETEKATMKSVTSSVVTGYGAKGKKTSLFETYRFIEKNNKYNGEFNKETSMNKPSKSEENISDDFEATVSSTTKNFPSENITSDNLILEEKSIVSDKKEEDKCSEKDQSRETKDNPSEIEDTHVNNNDITQPSHKIQAVKQGETNKKEPANSDKQICVSASIDKHIWNVIDDVVNSKEDFKSVFESKVNLNKKEGQEKKVLKKKKKMKSISPIKNELEDQSNKFKNLMNDSYAVDKSTVSGIFQVKSVLKKEAKSKLGLFKSSATDSTSKKKNTSSKQCDSSLKSDINPLEKPDTDFVKSKKSKKISKDSLSTSVSKANKNDTTNDVPKSKNVPIFKPFKKPKVISIQTNKENVNQDSATPNSGTFNKNAHVYYEETSLKEENKDKETSKDNLSNSMVVLDTQDSFSGLENGKKKTIENDSATIVDSNESFTMNKNEEKENKNIENDSSILVDSNKSFTKKDDKNKEKKVKNIENDSSMAVDSKESFTENDDECNKRKAAEFSTAKGNSKSEVCSDDEFFCITLSDEEKE